MPEGEVKKLLEYLSTRQPSEAKRQQSELAKVGIISPTLFRGPAQSFEQVALNPEASQDLQRRQQHALLGLAQTALRRAIQEFEAVRPRIEGRIRRAGKLRLTSAVLTTVLSSGVVASLSIPDKSSWGILLGILALLASILNLLASRLEGGEARLAGAFAEVASKYAGGF